MTKGVIQLFRESWKIYKSKFKIFLGIIAVPALLIIVGTFIPLVGKEPIKAFIIAIILLLIAIFIWLFTILAMLFSLRDNFDLKESYKKSFRAFFSFFKISFLLSCLSISWIITGIILSSLFIFFYHYLKPLEIDLFEELIVFKGIGLLYIIIGAILFIKFFPSIYLLIFEEEKGIKALSKSRELVAGKFWKVLWRIFVFSFTIAIIGFLLNLALTLTEINLTAVSIINYLFIWLIIPFCLIYGLLIYKNLKEIKDEAFGQILLKKRKTVWGVIGNIIIVLIGIFGALTILSPAGILGVMANIIYRADDELVPYDQDLWPPRIEIPIQDNAFYILAPYFLSLREKEWSLEHWPEQEKDALKAIEVREIYWPREKYELINNIIQGKEWNQEFVKHLLEKNRQVLEDFQKAAQLPYFQDPMRQNPVDISIDTPIFAVGGFVRIAEINAINSIYLFNQGKEEQAFEQAIKIIEIGQMFQDDQGSLISYLVGLRIKEIGLERIRAMISETTLSPEILKEYIVQLEPFKLNERGLANTLRIEYIFMINTLEEAFGDAPSSYFWKPNQTHRKLAEFKRIQINNAYKLCRDIIEPEIPKWPPSWIQENFIGHMIKGVVIVAIGDLNYRKCEEDFSVISNQLLLAIRAYQLDTGEIPISLDKLVPKYISEIPKDSFDGRPIRFCPEKKIIWSVGRDLIDEGGSIGEDWKEMPDPTFEINFKYFK